MIPIFAVISSSLLAVTAVALALVLPTAPSTRFLKPMFFAIGAAAAVLAIGMLAFIRI